MSGYIFVPPGKGIKREGSPPAERSAAIQAAESLFEALREIIYILGPLLGMAACILCAVLIGYVANLLYEAGVIGEGVAVAGHMIAFLIGSLGSGVVVILTGGLD
jgi:hypothetical protein